MHINSHVTMCQPVVRSGVRVDGGHDANIASQGSAAQAV